MEINLPLDKTIGATGALGIGTLLLAAYGRSITTKTIYITKLLVCGLAPICFKIPSKIWNKRKELLTLYGLTLLPNLIVIAFLGFKPYIELITSKTPIQELPHYLRNIAFLTVLSLAAAATITLINLFSTRNTPKPKTDDTINILNDILKDLNDLDDLEKEKNKKNTLADKTLYQDSAVLYEKI